MSDEILLDAEGQSAKRLKIDDEVPETSQINSNDTPGTKVLTRRQQKRLERDQRWLQRLPEKRAYQKAKLKEKRLHAKLNNIYLGPSSKELKSNKMEKSSCKIHVVIDLSFDDYMSNKSLSKCVKQILRCYSLNRRAKNPMQLHVTNFNGKSKEEMSKNYGYENWDLFFHEENYLDLFKKEDIIYLSSESENVVSCLEDNRIYIIGGLVDHNSKKGLCHRIALEQNLQHGQLPIGEYVQMKSRKVLTIDHVFEILLGVSEGKSWKDAFLAVLPSRKGVTLKEQKTREKDYSKNETYKGETNEENNIKGEDDDNEAAIQTEKSIQDVDSKNENNESTMETEHNIKGENEEEAMETEKSFQKIDCKNENNEDTLETEKSIQKVHCTNANNEDAMEKKRDTKEEAVSNTENNKDAQSS